MRKKAIIMLIVFLVLLFVGCDVAQEDDKEIIISNYTSNEIFFLYVSPSSSDSWGNDVLGDNTLSIYEEITVKVSGSESSFDIGAEDLYGNYYVIWGAGKDSKHINITNSDRVSSLNNIVSKNVIKK